MNAKKLVSQGLSAKKNMASWWCMGNCRWLLVELLQVRCKKFF
jgi:hypothetical protein